MRNIIKKVLEEEFKNKGEEVLYIHFKLFLDKKYDLIFSNRYDQYTDKVISVYSFESWNKNDYDDNFDVKLDGTVFNNPATIEIKEKFGLSSKEFEKFLLLYIEEYK